MGDLLESIGALIESSRFLPVKAEHRTQAGVLLLPDGRKVFVKRFFAGPGLRAWGERLRGSRAFRSIRGAKVLNAAGFRAPTVLAGAELRRYGGVWESYLIVEALEGVRFLSAAIDRRNGPYGTSYAERQCLIASVAREVRALHDAGLFTSDLQDTNVMVRGPAQNPEVFFVDLDGFRQVGRVGWSRRWRNLVQLDRSVGRFMSRSERLRFLRYYLRDEYDRSWLRRIVSELLRERARKDREYSRRRARRIARGAATTTEPLHTARNTF